MTDITNPVARRAFVTGLGVGAAALSAGLASRATAEEKPAPAAPAHWQPAMDAQDDWMELPGRHRLVFDATSAKGAGGALAFTRNYLDANKDGYGIESTDLATIVVLRASATAFGYNDTIWAKYGTIMGTMLELTDPDTKKAPLRNPHIPAPGAKPDPDAADIPALVARGVHFAICGAATHHVAGTLAKKTGGKAAGIYAELAANLIPNAHLVPAGIVAVNRAQERGYAFSYVG